MGCTLIALVCGLLVAVRREVHYSNGSKLARGRRWHPAWSHRPELVPARGTDWNGGLNVVGANMRLMSGKGGPGKGNSGGDEEGKTGLVTKTRPKTKKPNLYKVLLLNDDYTPMEFVVHVLERYFNKSREEATTIMLHVHQKGVGICGVFTYEVAETKVTQVMDFSRQHGHPLQCTLEKE